MSECRDVTTTQLLTTVLSLRRIEPNKAEFNENYMSIVQDLRIIDIFNALRYIFNILEKIIEYIEDIENVSNSSNLSISPRSWICVNYIGYRYGF